LEVEASGMELLEASGMELLLLGLPLGASGIELLDDYQNSLVKLEINKPRKR